MYDYPVVSVQSIGLWCTRLVPDCIGVHSRFILELEQDRTDPDPIPRSISTFPGRVKVVNVSDEFCSRAIIEKDI